MALDRTLPALSVKQPFAQQILLGIKRYEYRSLATHRRGRVYLYASQRDRSDQKEWRRLGMTPGEVKRGMIIGSVEVVDCKWSASEGCYRWQLKNPKALSPIAPQGKPQPVWFYPFTRPTKK